MSETSQTNGEPPKDVTDLRSKTGREKLVDTLLANTEEVDLAAYRPMDKGPTDWRDVFTRGTLAGEQLQRLTISPRKKLLADWFCEADLGFVFAARGVGKTWFSMMLALAVAEGGDAGPWKAAASYPVIYIDGEMPLELMQQRDKALGRGDGLIHYLNHEQLFNETGHVLNLANLDCQQALTALCVDLKRKVLVLDNLSCLFTGVKENDADDWEHILPWLLELRRRKIAVIFIVHAGRNGQMRGTSRREDAAAWVIRLDDATDATSARSGAKFVSSFTKPSRNTPQNSPPLEWSIATNASSGKSTVTYKPAEGEEAVMGWIRNGLSSCKEIADEMGVSNGTVSKMATKLMVAGRIKKSGRGYTLTDETGHENGGDE